MTKTFDSWGEAVDDLRREGFSQDDKFTAVYRKSGTAAHIERLRDGGYRVTYSDEKSSRVANVRV